MNIIPLIFSVQQGLPEKKILPPTVPESPAFALKKRIHREPTVEEVNTNLFFFHQMQCCSVILHLNSISMQVKQPMPMKAPPVPHFGLPFQPQLPGNHHVEVCPFSFEERERERKALKEKRLERKSEEVRTPDTIFTRVLYLVWPVWFRQYILSIFT